MAAVFDMRQWLTAVRRSKLSTRVTILFAAALVLPWFAYAWLTLTDRAEQVATTERHLAALAIDSTRRPSCDLPLTCRPAKLSRRPVIRCGRQPWKNRLPHSAPWLTRLT